MLAISLYQRFSGMVGRRFFLSSGDVMSRLFRIRGRLFGLVALAILGALVVAGVELRALDQQLLEDRKVLVRGAVDAAYALIQHEHDLAEAGVITVEEAQARAIKAVEAMRYLGSEYYFITDETPRIVGHPFMHDRIGQDMSDVVDPNGVRLFEEFVSVVRKDGAGFVSYLWPKTQDAVEPTPKISYVRGLALGAGSSAAASTSMTSRRCSGAGWSRRPWC